MLRIVRRTSPFVPFATPAARFSLIVCLNFVVIHPHVIENTTNAYNFCLERNEQEDAGLDEVPAALGKGDSVHKLTSRKN